MLQLDEHEHLEIGGIVSVLQDSVELDDDTKTSLKDTYQNVTELNNSRETQLKQSLLVRDILVLCRIQDRLAMYSNLTLHFFSCKK